MTRKRSLPGTFIGACLMLVCVPGFAFQGKVHHPARPMPPIDMNSPTMAALRQNAFNERLGKVAPMVTADWSSSYTRYVGCSDTPPSQTYPTIQLALVGVLPRTTIKVCPGNYPGNNIVRTTYVAIVGRGDASKIVVDCSIENHYDDDGIDLSASYGRVSNLTITNCDNGVLVGFPFFPTGHIVIGNEVSSSNLNNNGDGVSSAFAKNTVVENSQFNNNEFAGINNYGDGSDDIEGNSISGTFASDPVTGGIALNYSVGTKVKYNVVVYNNGAGLLSNSTQFNDIESNHFDHNGSGGGPAGSGIYLGGYYGDDGGKYKNNTASHNVYDGFYVDVNTGVDATSGQVPDTFTDNSAFSNGHLDYEDFSKPTNNPNTNKGTGNYWNDNEGNTANPPGLIDS